MNLLPRNVLTAKKVSIVAALCLMLASSLTARSANAASAPVPDGSGTLVQTGNGPVRGFASDGTSLFLGIPYAAPPVGSLRWRPPQPHANWSTPLKATAYGNTCAQVTELGVFAGPANANEDCLFLNVFVPGQPAIGAKLPVLVWIHGGGLVDGESNDYDARALAKSGPIIVVTINYRLGLLGYLGHPALDREGHPFGNYGLMDQQMALRWVHNNIAAFGGDPSNVGLGGQSAGSTSTVANVLSPTAAGLFQRAIFQSVVLDGSNSPTSLSLAEERGLAFGAAVGCIGTDAAAAACLRALPASQILALQGTPSTSGPYVNGLMVDGTNLPIPPDQALAAGQFNRMPVMSGNTEDELTFIQAITEYFSSPRTPVNAASYVADVLRSYSGLAGPGGAPPAYPVGTVTKVLNEYPVSNYATPQIADERFDTDTLACGHVRLDKLMARYVPVYAYEFDYQNAPYYFPPMPGFAPLASHTIDIQFLFTNWHGGPLGTAHPLNAQEKILSGELMKFWTNFTRTGNPNGSGNQPWPRFQLDPNAADYLSENIPSLSTYTGRQFSRDRHCGFWDNVLFF